MTAFELLQACFNGSMILILVYTLGISLVYFVLMVLGYFALQHYHGRLLRTERDALFKSPLIPRISVLVPARNESETILQSVKSMLTLRYPSHEVVVVNDGSTDDTLEQLIEEFRLYRSCRMTTGTLPTRNVRAIYESRDPIPLVVVDKDHGGKSDALNAGLNVSRAPLVAAVDADSILEPDALLHVMKPFLEDREPDRTLAAGGIVRVANGCVVEHGRVTRVEAPSSLLAGFQAIEYMRAFLGGRIAYSFLNSLLVISGAFGVFRRDAVIEAGGFDTNTVGEDMELVVRLHRLWRAKARAARRGDGSGTAGEAPGRYRIVFVPEPVSWTEVPESLEVLNRQRNRWQRGLTESLWAHRRMAFNPAYGVVGMFGFPYFFLFEMLGPTIELIGYLIAIPGFLTGLLSPQLFLLFFLVSLGFGTLLSISALLLEELTVRRYPHPSDVLRLFAAAVIENFGLRQLLTVWRTKALFDAFRGKKEWGKQERIGFRGPAGEVA
jgi:cellulose synthase/poly-beta-1,6-N-acetylglucosamine synthase-like glycosyltransferase